MAGDPRDAVLIVLDDYEQVYPHEAPVIDRVRTLVRERMDCLLRTCVPGHITGSAWIVSADFDRRLLTHHRKLDKWLQLGGHADGQAEPSLVALREAREESGMQAFDWATFQGKLVPLDIDVHLIPSRGSEPAHEHHDLRYLLIAPSDEPVRVSDESHDLRWFTPDELALVTNEESVWRMERKALRFLEDGFGRMVTPPKFP